MSRTSSRTDSTSRCGGTHPRDPRVVVADDDTMKHPTSSVLILSVEVPVGSEAHR